MSTVISSPAFSAGFQLVEHSSAGLGRAYAGEGVMNDTAAAGSKNPAAMTLFNTPTVSAGMIYVRPKINLKGETNMGNDVSVKNIAPNEIVPNMHFIYPVNDQWSLGLFGTSQYGLSTKFDENYAAGSLAGKTELVTGNFNAAAAYRLDSHWSFGFGLNAVYAKAKLIRYTGDMLSGMGVPHSTVASNLKGDKWGFGWNAGVLFELTPEHRFGLSYRSKVKLDFTGDYTSDLPPLSGKTTSGDLNLNLPDVWEFSGYHQLTEPLAIHYSIAYTKWNKFKELRGLDSKTGADLFFKDEQYSNSFRFSVGTTYQLDEQWTLRGGLALDKRASKAHPSISIPDQDRYWLSAGTTYHLDTHSFVDFGMSYLFGKDVKFTEPSAMGKEYHYRSDNSRAWLFGVNYNYQF